MPASRLSVARSSANSKSLERRLVLDDVGHEITHEMVEALSFFFSHSAVRLMQDSDPHVREQMKEKVRPLSDLVHLLLSKVEPNI
jgi:signal recognition particle GTPase